METKTQWTPPSAMPRMAQLASACYTGASNVSGICISLGEAITEVPATERNTHPAIKIVLGQLSFLCKESLGPTEQALQDYNAWTLEEVQ